MKLSTVLFLIVIVLLFVFSAANWTVITAPTSLSLVFTTVQAPLGLILLATILVVTVLFLGFTVYLQTSVLLQTRRHARDLEAQRKLADEAEASRFTDLRAFVGEQFRGLREHVDQVERQLKSEVETSINGLAAHLGELEDRLQRKGIVD